MTRVTTICSVCTKAKKGMPGNCFQNALHIAALIINRDPHLYELLPMGYLSALHYFNFLSTAFVTTRRIITLGDCGIRRGVRASEGAGSA